MRNIIDMIAHCVLYVIVVTLFTTSLVLYKFLNETRAERDNWKALYDISERDTCSCDTTLNIKYE